MAKKLCELPNCSNYAYKEICIHKNNITQIRIVCGKHYKIQLHKTQDENNRRLNQ